MGSYYAKAAGETDQVATIIEQHYKPKFAGDTLPDTTAGKLVALADEVNVEVISVTENNESLESYFMNLVAGKDGYL